MARMAGYAEREEDMADRVEAEARVRIGFRPYQVPVFHDRTSGVLVLHWARQIGKSFTLAAWAVDRLLTRPGRLVTVLSNSRDNGAEFVAKCAEVCRLNGTKFESVDKSRGVRFQNMRMEVRIRAKGRTGRIKVLAANPRTARGFSGDLILDEFAFHEDSKAIWEAAEPILASNPDFLCRIASTGNGKHNLFYRMTAGVEGGMRWERNPEFRIQNPEGETFTTETQRHGAKRSLDPIREGGNGETKGQKLEPPYVGCYSREGEEVGKMSNVSPAIFRAGGEQEKEEAILGVLVDSGLARSKAGFLVSRVTRTLAWQMGVLIYDANTRAAVSPETAREQALDKRAYDQNYECSFADENLTLLSHELINAAEREDVGMICEQSWVPAALAIMKEAAGHLYVGFDVARRGDLSVITVVEDLGGMKLVRGILRMQDLRLPEQQLRLGEICRLPRFRRAAIDMTGLGLGLFEYAQKEFGGSRIQGINFASTVPATRAVAAEGRKRETVRVTEALALELLQTYEDRRIQHPADGRLRDDLRKPEKVTSPGGRVSIAATRTEAGHADHFWSFALALEAAGSAGGAGGFQCLGLRNRDRMMI